MCATKAEYACNYNVLWAECKLKQRSFENEKLKATIEDVKKCVLERICLFYKKILLISLTGKSMESE